MNALKKIYCRCFQTAMRIALPFLPYRNPEILSHIDDIPRILRENNVKRPLIITDGNLSALGATARLQQVLKGQKIDFAFYDGAFPNPTTKLAGETAAYYLENQCDGLIAFGAVPPWRTMPGENM